MLQQNYRSNSFIIPLIFMVFMTTCSNEECEVAIQDSTQPAEETTTTTIPPQPVEEACVPIDNSSVSLSTTKDVQTFLYNNGFNPGEIDGYLGSATMDAI